MAAFLLADAAIATQTKALQNILNALPEKYAATWTELENARREVDAASTIDVQHANAHKAAQDEWTNEAREYQEACRIEKLAHGHPARSRPRNHSQDTGRTPETIADAIAGRQRAETNLQAASRALSAASKAANGAEARHKNALAREQKAEQTLQALKAEESQANSLLNTIKTEIANAKVATAVPGHPH
ncbi:hypothetical protein C8R45DRAFT_1101424 [Mycena sanguinolenta]|nr:hypothetical protein C8R45DRAFT_1101424 [Mycena sanguinolenta]